MQITLLQSSTVAFNWGISGPFWRVAESHYWRHIVSVKGMHSVRAHAIVPWQPISWCQSCTCTVDSCRYSAGAVLQIMLFGVMAIQVCVPVWPMPAHSCNDW